VCTSSTSGWSRASCTKSQTSRNSDRNTTEYWPWIPCNQKLSGNASWTVRLLGYFTGKMFC
jgi:hypothetical protein